MFEQNNVLPVHNLFIKLPYTGMLILVANKVYRCFRDQLFFWWRLKSECMGPYCEQEVQQTNVFLFNV